MTGIPIIASVELFICKDSFADTQKDRDKQGDAPMYLIRGILISKLT